MASKLLLFGVIAGGALIGSLYSAHLVLLVVSLWLAYQTVSPMLGQTVFRSLLLRLSVSLFVYMVLLQSIILASWLINASFPLSATIPITFVLLLFLFLFRIKKTRRVRDLTFDRHDKLALLLSLTILAPMVFLTVIGGSSSLTDGVQQLAVSGLDDTNHLQMFSVHAQYDRGIIYRSDAAPLIKAFEMYPAGWHSANALIAKAIYPSMEPGFQTNLAFIFSKLFWLFALLAIFARTVLLFMNLSSKKLSLLTVMWLLTSLYIFGHVFVADPYPAGAYSFVPTLMGGLLSVVLLLQLSRATKIDDKRDSLFLVVLAAIGGCLSWMLVLPAFVVGVIGVSFMQRKALPTKPRYIIPLALLVIGTASQLFVMLTNHSPGAVSFLEGINLVGSIMTNGPLFYVILLAGVVLFVRELYKRYKSYFHYLLFLLIPAFIFDHLVLLLQLVNTGEPLYYYFKALNLTVMMLLPMSIVGWAFLINRLDRKKYLAAAVFLLLFIFCIFYFVSTNLHAA